MADRFSIQTGSGDTPNITITFHPLVDRIEGLRMHGRVRVDKTENLSPRHPRGAVTRRPNSSFRDVHHPRAVRGGDFRRSVG